MESTLFEKRLFQHFFRLVLFLSLLRIEVLPNAHCAVSLVSIGKINRKLGPGARVRTGGVGDLIDVAAEKVPAQVKNLRQECRISLRSLHQFPESLVLLSLAQQQIPEVPTRK